MYVCITVLMYEKIYIFFTKAKLYSRDIYQDIHNFLEFSGTTTACISPCKIQSKGLEKFKLLLQPLMRTTMFETKNELRLYLSNKLASFTLQVYSFIEKSINWPLHCAGRCSGCWGYRNKWNKKKREKVPAPMEIHSSGVRRGRTKQMSA